ncbi:MAG TPA: extensin family protein [Afifellaceae bacterium]|nr:extensin family protein [Afifellaceae bacterium]
MPLWVRPALGWICLAAFAAAGQAQPIPESRPAIPEVPSVEVQPETRLPAPRPAQRPNRGSSESGNDARSAVEVSPPHADPLPTPADAAEEMACRRRLQALGARFQEMAPIDGNAACGAAAPLRVSEVGAGIELEPPATLNCRTAEALARWSHEVVVPAAERYLEAAPTALVNAASYVCRPRNNRPGARLSEHATANAIDIGGIIFDEGRALPVLARGPDEARERAFQRAIRRGACEHFTTVIGPGTNAAHATHFHLDLAERRGGYRLCE